MIIVDLETSGADFKESSILSIGAVDFNNPDNTFYGECKIRENAKIDPKAMEVNGFTLEQINNNPKSCEQLLKEFLNWALNIDDMTLAGHNVQFDFNFLVEGFKFYNVEWIFGWKMVDVQSIFYFNLLKNNKQIPLKNNVSGLDFDKILEYLNLKRSNAKHNALEDAKLAYEVFSALLDESSSLVETKL